MYNDADIEMMELGAAANAAAAVQSTRGRVELDDATRDAIVDEVASAGWFGGSMFEAVTDALADRGLVVVPAVHEDLHLRAADELSRRERAERDEVGR